MSQENIRVGDKVRVVDNSYELSIDTKGEIVPCWKATIDQHVFVVKEKGHHRYPCTLGANPEKQGQNNVKLWCEEHQYTRYTQQRFLRKIEPTTEGKAELLGVCKTHSLTLDQAVNRLYELHDR